MVAAEENPLKAKYCSIRSANGSRIAASNSYRLVPE
jgi:hypothetical protein